MDTPDRRARLKDIDAVKLHEPQQKKSKKWLIFAICVLILLFVAALAALGYQYYTENFSASDTTFNAHVLSTYTGSANAGNAAYAPYKDGILITTQTQTSFYNAKGEVEWQLDIAVLNPFLKVNESYILLAGKNSKELYLIRDGKIMIKTNVPYPIINAGVAANGNFFIIEDEPYYKGLLTVRDNKNKDLFVWHSGTSYIIDAAFNERTSQIAISTLTATPQTDKKEEKSEEKPDYTGALLLFKLHENAPYQTHTFANTIVANVYYDAGRYMVVTDSGVHAYNASNGGYAWSYDILPHMLQRINYQDGKLALLTVAEDGTQTLQLLRTDGKLSGKKIEGLQNISAVTLTKNILAAGSGSHMSVYSLRGDLRYHIALPKAYNDFYLYNNGQYMLGANNIVADILSVR